MEEFNATVYKKDSKGKIRMTNVFSNQGYVIQKSGLVDGNLTEHTSEAKPKNIGKTNSTTSEEQAVIEATAKITKKLKEGYFQTIEEAKNEKVIMPMLAKVFEKEAHKIDWNNAFVQPKLDGMRCLQTPKGKISRKNTPVDTVNHIKFNRRSRDIIIDGELYVHGESFQQNMKYIKKYRKGLTERIQHWVYDIISDQPFVTRRATLDLLSPDLTNCKLVPTYKVTSMKEVKNYHTQFLLQGFEGTMIRWGDEGYKVNGRSSNLLKYKDFIDETYEVIDVLPSDKNPDQGVIHCKIPEGAKFNGQTFGCGMKFSHAEREEILNNKKDYIGKTAEVRFFEYTDDGIPRFPVCVGFRLDK